VWVGRAFFSGRGGWDWSFGVGGTGSEVLVGVG
jgi:hypothetical protein